MISRIMKDFNDTSYALMASQGVTIILIVGFIYFAFKINKYINLKTKYLEKKINEDKDIL